MICSPYKLFRRRHLADLGRAGPVDELSAAVPKLYDDLAESLPRRFQRFDASALCWLFDVAFPQVWCIDDFCRLHPDFARQEMRTLILYTKVLEPLRPNLDMYADLQPWKGKHRRTRLSGK